MTGWAGSEVPEKISNDGDAAGVPQRAKSLQDRWSHQFRRIIKPGDQLSIEVTITTLRPKLAKMRATVRVGDELASEADLMCMITHQQADD